MPLDSISPRAKFLGAAAALSLGLAGALTAASPASAVPSVFTVTNTSSDPTTVGSLAWAITQANTNGNPGDTDSIVFTLPDLTIPLTAALPAIEESLTITGPDRAIPLEISVVASGVFFASASSASTLTLSGLELSGDGSVGPHNAVYAGGLTDLVVTDLIVHDFGGVGVFGGDNTTTITNLESYANEFGYYFLSSLPNGLPTDSIAATDVNVHDNDLSGAQIRLDSGASAAVVGGRYDGQPDDVGLYVKAELGARFDVVGVEASASDVGLYIEANGASAGNVAGSTTSDNITFGLYVIASGTAIVSGSGTRSDSDGNGAHFGGRDASRVTMSDTFVTGASLGIEAYAIDTAAVVVDGATEVTGDSSGGMTLTTEGAGSIDVRGANIHDNDGTGVEVEATGSSSVTIADSRIIDNTSARAGGVLVQEVSGDDTSLVIVRSSIAGNTATDGEGGGLAVDDVSLGEGYGVSIIDSTISGNDASDDGGGIYAGGEGEGQFAVLIQNSTISGNTAGSSGGAIWWEGDGDRTELVIEHSTIARNVATAVGGIRYANEGALVLDHTIIADHDNDLFISLPGATDVDATWSIIETPSAGAVGLLDGTGTRLGVDPKLGPLQHNGGPTETHFLLTGSPAIDSGDPAFVPPPATDQRGDPRVVNRIDVGAVEVPLALAATGSVFDAGPVAAGAVLLLLGGALVMLRRRRVADSEA